MRVPHAVFALAVVCVAAGAATAWPLLEHLGYALVAVFLLAAATVWAARRGLSVSRAALPDVVMTGQSIPIAFEVRKQGLLPALRLSLQHDEGERDRLGLRDGTRTLLLERSISRRGRHPLGGASLFAEDPFSMFQIELARFDAEEITVYPRPIPVDATALPGSSSRSSDRRWRLADADATLGDLRPYVPGDPPSRVHWRSTARSGTLMVTDPEQYRPSSVWLLVDLGGEDQEEERGPGIATYLAQEVLDRGLSLGVILAGREIVTIQAGRGVQQKHRVLRSLADTPSSRRSQIETLARLGSRLEHPGKLLVVSAAAGTAELSRSLRRACADVTWIPASDPVVRQ